MAEPLFVASYDEICSETFSTVSVEVNRVRKQRFTTRNRAGPNGSATFFGKGFDTRFDYPHRMSDSLILVWVVPRSGPESIAKRCPGP